MDHDIPQKISAAVRQSFGTSEDVRITLCGVPIHIKPDSDSRALCVEFVRAYYSPGTKHVGPYPDRGIFITEGLLCRCSIEKELLSIPDIQLVNKIDWEYFISSASDSCGLGQMIVAYASRWARLMQSRCQNGNIGLHALRTSFEADFDNIRDIALPIALVALRNSWIHGASLLHASHQFTRFTMPR